FALSMLGGGMIIWLGISMFRARSEFVRGTRDLPYNAFTAGILTSLLNPFFLLWWATIGSMLIMKFVDFGISGLALLTVTHWLCDLIWLSFVSITVFKTHSLWGRKFQERLFTACSLVLTGFGIWYMITGVQLIA
ncbi:MAG: LysE family transporter, partial [Dehalococcoidales bacterium]|nr:LysE family transporter [Dehalococcoidales bacterium]